MFEVLEQSNWWKLLVEWLFIEKEKIIDKDWSRFGEGELKYNFGYVK